MKVSVIIPTYNGAHKLPTILKSLEQQTFSSFETLVMIDGSTDDTLQALQAGQYGLNSLRIVEQPNRGRAAVRNNGAQLASGELLLFFDDDMRLMPDCIQTHLDHHQKVGGGTMVMGRTQEDFRLCKTDFHFYRAHLSEKWLKPLSTLKGPLPSERVFLTAANFSVHKTLFQQLGGFNQQLKDAEDYELAIRAKNAGVPLYYLHQAIAWHDDFFSMSRYISRQQEYQKAHEMLLQMNLDVAKREKKKPVWLKKQLMKLFRQPVLVRIIDGQNFFSYLPKPVKYKLYDLVVYSHLENS